MDVGLIEVDNVYAWKTDIPGIAPVGPMLDLYGGHVSPLKGQEEAEKRNPNKNISLPVHHGDSGMVLYIEPPLEEDPKSQEVTRKIFYPFGLLWGKKSSSTTARSRDSPMHWLRR
jgi:hypothetical protein